MSVTIELTLNDAYADALDTRIDQLVEERLDEVSWPDQEVSVTQESIPGRSEYIGDLIRADLSEAGLEPWNPGGKE